MTPIVREPLLLHDLLPKEISSYIADQLANQGIIWQTNTQINDIVANANTYQLSLSKYQEVKADVILAAIGLQVDITIVQKADIEVNNGVIVDEYLQTNKPNIYALGDCAEMMGSLKQFIAPINHAVGVLAKNLIFGNIQTLDFPPMPISIKTTSCPIIYLLPVSLNGQWQFDRKSNGISAIFYDQEEVTQGFILVGQGCVREKIKYAQLIGLKKTLTI